MTDGSVALAANLDGTRRRCAMVEARSDAAIESASIINRGAGWRVALVVLVRGPDRMTEPDTGSYSRARAVRPLWCRAWRVSFVHSLSASTSECVCSFIIRINTRVCGLCVFMLVSGLCVFMSVSGLCVYVVARVCVGCKW